MKEEIINYSKSLGNILIDKCRELDDPKEVGKIIRTLIVTFGVSTVSIVLLKNGGINYNNKLYIGVSNNKLIKS